MSESTMQNGRYEPPKHEAVCQLLNFSLVLRAGTLVPHKAQSQHCIVCTDC